MKVTVSKSKNRTIYYISKSIRLNGRSTTRTVEKLGTEEEVRRRAGGMDPYEWAKQYAAELTRKEKESGEAIRYSPTRLIRKNANQTINISYLFPQDIYYDLRIHEICDDMTERYSLPFDLNAVFSRLVYTRVIYHASKHGTYNLSRNFQEKPKFDLEDIDQALRFLAVSPLTFQRQLYEKITTSYTPANKILFYDCSSYFFEIGEKDFADKKNRSSSRAPIVQLGLLCDGRGVPLSFDMLRDTEADPPGITGLEKDIIRDFAPEQIVICSEAGLTQIAEKKFRDYDNTHFVNVDSVSRIDKRLRSFALDAGGWHLPRRKQEYRIDEIDEEKHFGSIFYKEKTVTLDERRQRMIVTFSLKQRARQRWIRQRQLTRVSDIIESSGPDNIAAADRLRNIANAERFDGFSVLFTDLEYAPGLIIPLIRRHREIEENFRTVKRELQSRTLELKGREKLNAHFIICFFSSLIERIIETKLKDRYAFDEISDALREMDMLDIPSEGYIPIYSRNDLTDALHEAFGFRTDNQITSGRTIRKLCADTKKPRALEL